MNNLQERIGYLGNLQPILTQVCTDYNIGRYISYSVIPMGYEDFNICVETSSCKFFVKIFAAFRDRKNCERYMQIVKAARYAGISQPEIYQAQSQQEYVYESSVENRAIRLCVMQYIDGETLFESRTKIDSKEAFFLIKEAALINKIPLEPSFVYDSWAINNFLKSWEERKQYVSPDDYQLIVPLIEPFQQLNLEKLPHCFVHGDLIKTNIMRDKQNTLYVLDFSVAN